MININWSEITHLCQDLLQQIRRSGKQYDFIYAVPKGGLVLGVMLSHGLGVRMKFDTYNPQNLKYLVVDEINDTGRTLYPFTQDKNADIAVLYTRFTSPIKTTFTANTVNHNHFLVFPWELAKEEENAVY